MKGLDLAKFKKISENKDSATMKHDDGHTLMIAKDPLSALQKKQLEKLPVYKADGGTVVPVPKTLPTEKIPMDGPMYGSDYKSQPYQAPQQDSTASPKDVMRMNNFVKDKNPPLSPEDINKLYNQTPSFSKGGKVQKMADGGELEVEPVYSNDPENKANPDDQSSRAPAQNISTNQEPNPQMPLAANEAAFRQEQEANTKLAQAQAGQGKAEVAAANQMQAGMGALPTQQQVVDSYKAKDDMLAKAFQSNTIDPNRYWNNKGTLGQIAGGIGMILSGGGGALAGQAPMAQQVIQTAINNDIDAQKNDQTKDLNLWKMNREALGTDVAANLATKNQLLLAYQTQLGAAANQFKGPIALANAQKANAQIEQEINLNRFKLSLMGGQTKDFPDPASRIQFLVPPDRQQKALDEIDSAQNTTHNAPAIMNAFDKASHNMSHIADYIPGIENADQKQLHALLGPTFKDVEGTVRQAAMDNLFNSITPQFGDNKNTIATKRAALTGYISSKQSAPTNKAFGIDLSKFPSTRFNPPPAPVTQPKSRIQNGHTYFLNPKTGKYE